MKKLTVRMSDSMHMAFRRIARARGKSMALMVREMLDERIPLEEMDLNPFIGRDFIKGAKVAFPTVREGVVPQIGIIVAEAGNGFYDILGEDGEPYCYHRDNIHLHG